MKFSERKGFTPVSQVIQVNGVTPELRNSLWNVLDRFVWQSEGFLWQQFGQGEIDRFAVALWSSFFKRPADERPGRERDILASVRGAFFDFDWFELYDFVEWTLNYIRDDELNRAINYTLERELAGYRYVGGQITEITNQQELEVLEEVLSDDKFGPVNEHLKTALRHLSNRSHPDYRNSIKESISAVEGMAKIVSGNQKATLGDALAEMEKTTRLHPALKQAFAKLYGYTSDADGIRHAMLGEPNLSAADAKFFLLSCTSFINYMKSLL